MAASMKTMSGGLGFVEVFNYETETHEARSKLTIVIVLQLLKGL